MGPAAVACNRSCCPSRVVRVDELVDQARLPHTGLPDHGYYLAMPRPGPLQRLLQGRPLPLPSHERCEPTRHRGLQTPADRTGADQLKDLHGLWQPPDGNRPRALTWTSPSTSRRVAAVSRILPGDANCSRRAARCVVWPTAEYSICRSLPIARTTTSPELSPTRICISRPWERCTSSA